jgi:hypothetical protein
MIKNISLLLLVLFIYSCKNSDIKTTYHKDDVTIISAKIPDTQDSLRTYYNKSGKVMAWDICKKGAKQTQSEYHFSTTGDIDSMVYYKNGKKQNCSIYFDDSLKIKNIINFRQGGESFNVTFNGNGISDQVAPERLIIKKADPFITIDPVADTITLGETYSVRVVLNFPIKGFECEIRYLVNSPYYYHVSNEPDVIFTETPTDTGVHTYRISVINRPPNNQRVVGYDAKHFFYAGFKVNYYVKPKN